MSEKDVFCVVCGEVMPKGEQMFKFHGYSGNCPKPPLPRKEEKTIYDLLKEIEILKAQSKDLYRALSGILEIGKRDMSNPKYDGYFNTAKEAAGNYKV